MFRNRLQKVYRHLSKTAKRLRISCYRIYDHDLPEFPFCIEIYDSKLYVAEYRRRHGMTDEEHELWIEGSQEIMSEVLEIDKENIFLKLRQRKPGRQGQYQKQDQSRNEFIIEENGLKFIVNLNDYLDTGLFLDHRITRQMVGEECKNKNVLNLFAYTGSFSVYPAAGGANKVVTVDLSKTYLDWARRNFEVNGFDSNDPRFDFIHADVMQYLKQIKPLSFDLIVMDPPTFSNSKRMDDILDIQRDHVELINDCIRILNAEGVLFFSTNNKTFQLEAKKIKASGIKDITKKTTPFDFEGRLFRKCYRITK